MKNERSVSLFYFIQCNLDVYKRQYSENNEAGDEIRHYPYENMFAHIIGYTSYGKAGLESVCNSDLLTSHEKLMKQLSNEMCIRDRDRRR